MDAFFFWLFSLGMIVAGLAVILNRNPVASALCFACSIICMSGLFVLLSAFFLAAVQILVTAGAVMVLFLFIIMLLNPEAMEHTPRPYLRMILSLALGLGFVFLVARTLRDLPQGGVKIGTVAAMGTPAAATATQSAADHQDDTHQIGRLLFTSYVAPFEVTSLLILVATIGVIVLCKEDKPTRRAVEESIPAEPRPPAPSREAKLARTR